MCVGCGVSLPGRHANTARCALCHRSFRAAKQREHRNKDGYVRVYVPGDPHAQSDGWALEHRVVMATVLGRPLLPEETVHHVNGDRTCNTADNLEVWSSRHPKGQRCADLVAWAKELLALYEPEALAARVVDFVSHP